MVALAGAIVVAGGVIGHAIAWSSVDDGDRISAQIPADIGLVVGAILLFIGVAFEFQSRQRFSR